MSNFLNEYNKENFADSYPKFRLLTIICACYWIFLIVKLFFRQNLEFGDQFSLILYAMFVMIHLLIFVATYISDKILKGKKLIFYIAIIPFVLSFTVISISILANTVAFFENY